MFLLLILALASLYRSFFPMRQLKGRFDAVLPAA